ncbi:MAG: GH3 auxin-responsive promoter family protein, partial [Planctomycetaceae bacterium]|nr:GH3 auxin-responsive promoter family protein [Planctomycetaceae bacterium]
MRKLVNAGFHLHARLRTSKVDSLNPRRVQEQGLLRLVRAARATRFGRDHGFDRVRSVADYQKAVPLRTYETLWNDYLRSSYPVFENLTWPGRIPFLAL